MTTWHVYALTIQCTQKSSYGRFYLSNDKSDFEEYNESYNKNYSEIYKENFSYLKMLAEINYIRINFLTSIIAMFASSIAAIIAIIALFA